MGFLAELYQGIRKEFLDTNIYVSLFISIVSGITLLVFYHANHYKRMERYFYHTNKYLYITIEVTYYILFISFVYNTRFIAFEFFMYVILLLLKINKNLKYINKIWKLTHSLRSSLLITKKIRR